MSETPRTDGESKWDALNGWWVPSDFSRTLERELAAAHAASEALQPGIDHLRETCDALERERNEARTKRLQTLANVADECDALRAELAVSEKSSAEYMTERNQARDLVHTMAGICASGCGDNKPRSSIEWAEHILAERDALRAEVERLTAAKDGAYEERNRCVALIARMALSLGCRAGLARTAIEGWSDDWHGCIYIDLPTGQVSWHYHDSHAHLFEGLPQYAAPWDGHDTPEKYRRVDAAREFRSAEVEACAPYLKEGETPAERIQRDIADNAAVLSLLAKSRAEVERLRGALGGIRDRDFKLSDAKRRARRALTRVEEPKPVCGECHLQPGERCDVCGATDPRPKPAEEPK